MSIRRVLKVSALALSLVLVLPAGVARGQTTYEVYVGLFLEGPAPAESMRFFPDTIAVHRGDTLHFTANGFHTATLLPVGTDPVQWFDTQATDGTEQPYSLTQPDPDDGPTTYKFGLAAIFPTDPACGAHGQPACSFDGTGVLNSGAPLLGPMDFTATIDVAAGSSFYVVCIVHGAAMRMRVNVVSGPADTQGEIDDRNAAAIEQDLNTSAALDARFSARQTSHRALDGTRVWDAWAGVESHHVTLYGMYPRRLHIGVGDTVQWHFDSLTYEVHTVTFPIDTAREIFRNDRIVCDPDGDGPGPDNPPDLEDPPFCSDPTQLEVKHDDRFVTEQGNGRFRGTDLENSGVRGGPGAFGDANYDLRFTKRSPRSGFGYLCLIHPFMKGRVVVR